MMNPSAAVPKRSDVSDMEQAPTPRASTKQHMSSSNNVLNLSELPPHVAEALKGLDKDGDGHINLSELHIGAQEASHSVSKHAFYRKLFLVLFGIWLAQLASTFGVMFGTVNYAKESHVSDAAVMTTRDGLSVVQTAVATLSVPLSSALPDDAFLELKTIGLTSPTGATMHLTVLGFLRMPGAFGQVTIITHIGRIVLDGTSLSYFDDSQAALFEAAGFTTNGATRRLLQVRALFGIFNAVSSVSSYGLNAPPELPPPTLPAQFTMFARRLTPCIPVSPPAGQPVPLFVGSYTGGPLPRTGVDLCALLNIDDAQLVHSYTEDGSVDQRFIAMSYTMIRLGSTQLRVEYEHPLVPGQMLVEVLDNTDASAPVQFSYQVSSSDKGIALLPQSDGSVPALVGPISYYNATNVTQSDLVTEALGAPFDYLGNTTLAGEDVRIWAMHLMDGKFTAYWYDSLDTQTVRRIAFGDFGVLDVVSITPLEGDANENAHLFMQPTAGVTDFGDATVSGGAAAALPKQISLDPFAPYVKDFKVSSSSSARRRTLMQAPRAAFAADNTTASGFAGGRSLMQLGGCSATNKCPIKPTLFPGGGGYANQAVVIAIPGVPVGFAIGPVNRAPCMYETTVSVSPTQILIPLPITISGTLGVLLCSDLTSYEAIYGTLAAAVGIPGISPTSPLSLFSWQIASITVSIVNEIQELQCTVDGAGALSYDSSDAAMLGGMVQRFGTSAARSNCDCLRNTGQRSGVGFAIGGPDIPGFALLLLPFLGQIIAPLSPFLAFVKMRPTASWTFFPYFCNLSRNDLDFVITLTLDLIFFKDSVNIFDPAFNILAAYGGTVAAVSGPVGMELPEWASASDAITATLIETVTMIGNKLKNNQIDWTAIVGVGTDLRNAASNFFSQSGATNDALTRIFRPSRMYEYGCFSSYWTGGQCTNRIPKRRIFGRTFGGQCITWAPYTLHCGSTQRCIANCR